jgi:hypothetical protein
VNRRQFLGASLGALIAALSLPFERFAEWCRAWLKPKHRELFEGVNRAVKFMVDPNIPRGQAWFMRTRAFPPGVTWMHPDDVARLEAELV